MTVTAKRELTAQSKENAWEIIRGLAKECRDGVSDCEAEAISLAELWLIDPTDIPVMFARARRARAEEATKAAPAVEVEAAPQAEVKPAPKFKRLPIGKDPLFISAPIQPKAEARVEPTTEAKPKAEAEVGAKPKAKITSLKQLFKFHPSDLAEPKAAPPTIEEKNQALEELADLWRTDPIAFAEKKHELAKRLCTTVMAIERAVKVVRDRRDEEGGEQSQTTKLAAICASARLWRSPDAVSYASVRVGDHSENYRIGGTGFEEWLQFEYGKRNQIIGEDGRSTPQVPGAGAMRDAIAQAKGMAKFSGLTFQPAIRVGGDREVIWIDLGWEDWRAVRVTAEGWDPVAAPNVPFIRTGNLLALPEPVRGGSPEPFWRMINVRKEDRVVSWGWMLQALNPVGPYPGLNPCGSSEDGKSTVAKMVRRTVDPNLAGLRRSSRKVEDVLIAALNGWVVNIDNLSSMTPEWSDTLCMIMTGISSGTRAHYTNDEEHAFTVQRPVIFNGISESLLERADLASRTIKLQIPKLEVRRSERDLEQEFAEIWPGVFGALLDGLVGALRDSASIRVAKPARLMDFEQFAEAGCRVHFKKLEFVEAYAANRSGSMIASADASAVGRAVLAFVRKHPEGFEGMMSVLLAKLGTYRGNAGFREWPKDATRLSTELSRLEKPLAAVGITCLRHVDRRKEGGTQFDVILRADREVPV